MAAADRNLEEEFDTLKAGLERCARTSARSSAPRRCRHRRSQARGRRTRAAVGRATDRAGEVWDDATNEASRRGREGVAAVKQEIEERPFISVLVAFGIGVVIGKLINR